MTKDTIKQNYQEVISMEEYLNRRQKIREKEQQKKKSLKMQGNSI